MSEAVDSQSHDRLDLREITHVGQGRRGLGAGVHKGVRRGRKRLCGHVAQDKVRVRLVRQSSRDGRAEGTAGPGDGDDPVRSGPGHQAGNASGLSM